MILVQWTAWQGWVSFEIFAKHGVAVGGHRSSLAAESVEIKMNKKNLWNQRIRTDIFSKGKNENP